MAKVIGQDPDHIKKVSCRNCASVVEYTRREIVRVDGTDYGGGPDGCNYIICPECKERILLESW